MQRRFARFLWSVAVAVVAAVAVSAATAQSQQEAKEPMRAPPGDVVGVLTPPALELPTPKRIEVSARPVDHGEIVVIDGLRITVSPRRSVPNIVDLRPPRVIALSGHRNWVEVDLPNTRPVRLSARRQWIEVGLPPLRRIALSGHREWIDVELPRQRRIALSGHREWVDVDMPRSRTVTVSFDPNWVDVAVRPPRKIEAVVARENPGLVLITEPLSTSAVIERLYPLDLFQVEARRRNVATSAEVR